MSERQPKAVANDTVQTTTYRRDRARPCPQQTDKNKTIIGCY